MLKLVRVLLVVAAASLLVLPAAAQNDTNPLLELLAFVPDTEETWAGAPLFTYADYRAFEAASGIETPSARDFAGASELSRQWLAAMSGLASGLPMNYFMQYLDGMPEAVGFSWFDINRALTFGQPPAAGKVLSGSFDLDAIGAAFAARDYSTSTAAGAAVWCPPDGCDSGQAANLRLRNPANPFGGELGRSEPIAALPGVVVNSASYGVLTAMLDAHEGEPASLADNPDVRAAANALAGSGLLRQAQFFKLEDVGLTDPMAALEGADFLAAFGELAPFRLMFVADVVEGDEQVGLIGLVYDSAETANAAAEELLARVQVAQSFVTQQPWLTMIEERGLQLGEAYAVQDGETGRVTALLEIRAPLPDSTQSDRAGGTPFGLLLNAIIRRDLSILWVDIPR